MVFRKPKSTFLTFEKIKVISWTFEKLQVLPWTLSFFLKSTRPSLPLKKAPPLSPSPFPLRVQGMYQPPYSVLKPLRYKVGGPSEVYASSGAAVFCAGMNPLSLKDLLKGCLLVAFFENLPVLLLLIKRAALGIVQANLTLLSFAQPFPSGDKGCANRPFNSLYDPFGSPCRGQKRCSNRYAIWLADH